MYNSIFYAKKSSLLNHSIKFSSIQTKNSSIYPNVKKDWEELGYNNKDIFEYGDFILNVSFSDVTEISLLHGVTNISLKIDGIKLCKVIN